MCSLTRLRRWARRQASGVPYWNLSRSERNEFCENLGVIVRPATVTDAVAIASLLNAHLATTTIEWTDTPQAPDDIPEWLDEHETVLGPAAR